MKLIKLFTVLAFAAGNLGFAQTNLDAIASRSSADKAVTNAALAIMNNEKIAFLGDSITQMGADLPGGYVRLVISGLQVNGVTAIPIPAGLGGDKSDWMLGRLRSSVLNKKPDWMTLSCGVNDVWHGANGTPLDQYRTNITAIVDQAQIAGIKVMILTATMIGEDPANPNNQKLAAYNDFLRQLAKEKKCLLADLNADMQAALKPGLKGRNQLTRDGVHMNPFGDQIMASGLLRGFGMNESQIQKARDYWINMPEVACTVSGNAGLTLRQYKQLSDLSAREKRSVDDLINAELTKALQLIAPSESVAKP